MVTRKEREEFFFFVTHEQKGIGFTKKNEHNKDEKLYILKGSILGIQKAKPRYINMLKYILEPIQRRQINL